MFVKGLPRCRTSGDDCFALEDSDDDLPKAEEHLMSEDFIGENICL
jgi:hypothetical protein